MKFGRGYACDQCGGSGCKLWRIFNEQNGVMLCAICVMERDEGVDYVSIEKGSGDVVDGSRDRFVPAIPLGKIEDTGCFFSVKSAPQSALDFWLSLKPFPKTRPIKRAL